jgi:hypothetical protein
MTGETVEGERLIEGLACDIPIEAVEGVAGHFLARSLADHLVLF